MKPATTTIAGLLTGLLSYALFSWMDLFSKLLDGAIGTLELICLNAAAGLVAFLLWSKLSIGQWLPLPVCRWRVALTGVLNGIGLLVAFYGYRTMPTIADAYAIAFSGPLIAVILGRLILKEKVTPDRWLAVFIGFGGVLLVLKPGLQAFSLASLAPLAAASCFAAGSILIRNIGQQESAQSLLIFSHMALLLCLLPVLILLTVLGAGEAAPPSLPGRQTMLLMFGAAAAYVCAEIAIVRALQLAEASFVSPMSFSQIIWAVAFELAIWGAVPELTTFIGVAIVILSNLYIIADARKRGAEESPALHVVPDASIPATMPETVEAVASSH